MSRFFESVAILNSAIRTVLGIVLVGGLGVSGWYGYTTYHAKDLAIQKTSEELANVKQELEQQAVQLREKEEAIGKLKVDVEQKQREIERLDTALTLLKVDHRVARLTVLDQSPDADSGKLVSVVEFQELNDEGKTLDTPRRFRIAGDVVYVDAWIVKFDDKYVEAADIDRATSLVLFRRIFGEAQQPLEGFVLDEAGVSPAVYRRGNGPSELERRIWGDFWSVANDETKQAELGIRAAHGEVPSIKLQKGKTYRLGLRASGGLSITNEGDAPKPAKPAA